VLGSIAKTYTKPVVDIGFGASNLGASLGYSPQAGGTLGASHILGIPNPIAAFTSPAGKQGMGTAVNAAEASFGGTGIGFGEANSLREALAGQGWSNEREGGLLGSAIGGSQENIALALEPAMKKGIKNPEVLSEFGSALKLGNRNLSELKDTVDELGKTAITTNQNIEKAAAGMQEYAAKAVEGGSTMMHGMQSYNTIGQQTGMNPTAIQGINESNFGKVQALSKGILPWQVQGMSSNQSTLNAYETLKKVESYVPKQAATFRTNSAGEKEEVESSEAKRLAWIHQLDPNVTAEQAKRLKEIGPKLEHIQIAEHQSSTINQHRYQSEETNERQSPQGQAAFHAMAASKGKQDHIAALEAEAKKLKKEGWGPKAEQIEDEIKEEKNSLKNTLERAQQLARSEGKLKPGQKVALETELHKHGGLFEQAKGAGVSDDALKKIEKDPRWKQATDIKNALANINKVKVEEEKQGNAKIELGPAAARFFKIKFSDVSKEESNAGGSSTTSKAAQPKPGTESALVASANKSTAANVRQETGREAPAYYGNA
jgi:hypothetical protein